MKKIFTSILCFMAFVCATQAQPVLYGTTDRGGTDNAGVIFSYKPSTNTIKKVAEFNSTNGNSPTGHLAQADDGKLYGMTFLGGNSNQGVIFSYDPATGKLANIVNFNGTDGANPNGNSVVKASNGKLYGTTYQGGSNNFGVLFSLDPATAKYTKLLDFDDTNGANPAGALIQATNGKLYGVTYAGGATGGGVIFSFDPTTAKYTKVYEFDPSDPNGKNGYNPQYSLTQASDGKLYGMTTAGGNNSMGVIFSFDPVTAKYAELLDFDEINTRPNFNGLVQASNGKLYGLYSAINGVIFSLDPATAKYNQIIHLDYFGDRSNGVVPRGSLLQASDGKLYGAAGQGGAFDVGTIFSINPATDKFTKVLDLDGSSGVYPNTGFAFVEYKPVEVKKKDQTITFAAIPDQAPDVKTVTLSATASSGLPVTFTVVSGPATVSGNTLTITGRGTIIVRASQKGNDEYNGAPNVDRTFCAQTTFYEDKDGDGHGNAKSTKGACTQPSGYVTSKDDCNDSDATIYPDAEEICGDNKDNDCDGTTDEDCTTNTYYQDKDSDGYGNPDVSKTANTKPEGYVTDKTDCDDSDAAVHPGAAEVCNGRDDDCDGQVDEGVTSTTYYWDADGDGYGRSDSSIQTCMTLQGYVTKKGDCNDADKSIHPDATEVCGDGKDNNCDGTVDNDCEPIKTWYRDVDGDGYGDPETSVLAEAQPEGYVSDKTDCDDSDKNTYPDATEVCFDGKDNDCDGTVDEDCNTGDTWYKDADKDGYGDPSSVVNSNTQPDGYVAKAGDCNDGNAAIHPGAEGRCNGLDDDCDGLVDEDCTGPTWYRDADGDGFGNPNSTTRSPQQPNGYVANNLDCNDKNKTKGGPEVCDGRDNDCDGVIDNGFALTPFYSDWDGDGYGTPKRMVMACAAPPRFVANSEDLNDDNGTVYPGAPELCDGRDNNQDGTIDEGFARTTFYHDFDKDGYGRTEVTLQACAAPLNYVAVAGDCNDRDASIHPGARGSCNGKDDDCDGKVDEDCRNSVTHQKGVAVSPAEVGVVLQLTASPNPTTHYFTLRLQSASDKAVHLRVVDAVGRVVEARQGVAANSTLTVGNTYRPGVYYVQALQGTQQVRLKLVKQTP